MASEDRWTEGQLRRVLPRLADGYWLTVRDTEELVLTALDALRAAPRWVRYEDWDELTMHQIGVGRKVGQQMWIPVVPLPLPPLPEEDEGDGIDRLRNPRGLHHVDQALAENGMLPEEGQADD